MQALMPIQVADVLVQTGAVRKEAPPEQSGSHPASEASRLWGRQPPA